MRLTFLGTGTSQGVPVIACGCAVCQSQDKRDKHLRTSALVETDEGKNILIDIGPDFREQMLREKVSHLDSILITHAHRDHVGGLDDIRSFNYVQHCKMEIFCNHEARTAIERDYHYIFAYHEFPGLPEANLHEVSGDEPFEAAGVEVIPVKAMHKDLPILGYRIGKLGYITDANHIEPRELDKLRGVDVLVINALRKTKHFSHFCLEEALEVIKEVEPSRAYITHVSHEMGLYAEVNRELPEGVQIACDGEKVTIQ
ncbi:MAG: MBL fold metallo-hydrolase [Bacteroidales bacterium]|nr:MBL fold metallo-hydrolase [Bacteroidales bacterium]